MKKIFLLSVFSLLILGHVSCSKIPSYIYKSGEETIDEEVEFNSESASKADASCRKPLDKALKAFDKDIPLIGSDLDSVVNLLSQYQSCQEVKRDDRIADVLLKMLKRIKTLEGDVAELKAMSIAPNP